ncbi:bcl-2-like protein 15 [Astyanax mexicanus]|uniref:bcl-2-like protein 15 n=1 Tax=Astyanax mexicanus TaxID=7994 RepID=UPI000BBD8DDE|nr:bcl-2-like protein 15 [Astyanax mexicanus]
MAPRDFEEETFIIISCLFQDERDTFLETDGPEDDDSDAARIAAKLRELGDHYDETVIQPLIKEVQSAAKDQVLTAFSNSVETLCKTWVAERPEVASEKQLLKASITLALYMKKNCPDMTRTVQSAMNSFINNRLANWIIQQGGWEQASSC